MADSIRKRILAAVRARLAVIQKANNYATDAGLYVFTGVLPMLGPDDPEAVIAVVPQDVSPTSPRTPMHVVGDWPIDIIAVANASKKIAEPWMLVEDVLADVQRAMELEDRTLGGLIRGTGFKVDATRTFERESASEIVAVSQTYTLQLQRVFGHPAVAR